MRKNNSNPGLGPELPSVTPFGSTEKKLGIHLYHHVVIYIFKQNIYFLRYVDKYDQPTAPRMAQINTKHTLN